MTAAPDTIAAFRFHEVVVPANPGVINSRSLDKPLHMLPVAGAAEWGVQFDELPKLLMEMDLADGTTAYGEFYRDHDWRVVENIARSLLGVAINDLSLQDLPIGLCREYDGFECAIWDAYAKVLKVPLHRLLGGAVRQRVKVGAWSSHRTPDEVGAWVKQYADAGYDCIKFKCDLDDDVGAWCRAIADAAPGMSVILDPNQRWENAGIARGLLNELAPIGNVLLLEDPIPRWMLHDYAQLRAASPIPIVLHVSLPYVTQGQRAYEAISALQHHAVDGFNFNAGLAKFKILDAIADTAGVPCWHGSEIDLGVLEAMYVHQVAAAPSCVWPSDIFGRMIRCHDMLATPLRFDPPYVEVPEGLGLGVSLDWDAIARHKTSERTVAP